VTLQSIGISAKTLPRPSVESNLEAVARYGLSVIQYDIHGVRCTPQFAELRGGGRSVVAGGPTSTIEASDRRVMRSGWAERVEHTSLEVVA
jgi:hypothetical protein